MKDSRQVNKKNLVNVTFTCSMSTIETRSKLYRNCQFPQNIYTKNLGEILLAYTVSMKSFE